MANSRSARKRVRANERKRLRNRSVRSAVRTYVSKARRAILGVDATVPVEERLRAAIRALDRAAEKGIIHRNNAARRKSRLMALANKLARAAAGEEQAVRAEATGGEKGRGRATRARAGAATKSPKSRASGQTGAAATARSKGSSTATRGAAGARTAAARASRRPADAATTEEGR